jgi:hypothetical protein
MPTSAKPPRSLFPSFIYSLHFHLNSPVERQGQDFDGLELELELKLGSGLKMEDQGLGLGLGSSFDLTLDG